MEAERRPGGASVALQEAVLACLRSAGFSVELGGASAREPGSLTA
jgi:hypothetical protein